MFNRNNAGTYKATQAKLADTYDVRHSFLITSKPCYKKKFTLFNFFLYDKFSDNRLPDCCK